MTQTFQDRTGKTITLPQGKESGTREGVFAICVCKDKLLLVWPNYARDVPDLPGGGIDEGETPLQALQREFLEETGMSYAFPEKTPDFTQDVYFFADDLDEYWLYHQEFFVYRFDNTELFFDDKRANPEDGHMMWFPLEDIDQKLNLHYMHRKALLSLDIIKV